LTAAGWEGKKYRAKFIMKKTKILFACKIADIEAKKRIEQHAAVIELDECTEQSILDNVAGCTALIVPFSSNMAVTKKVIDAGKDLKLVGTTYGGTRQNVDDIYALGKGLYVIHTGPTRPRPMAEYTLGLVLSSLLEIHNYHHHMNSDALWPRLKYERSRILHNRRVGIIGFGLIGQGIHDLFSMFTRDIWVRSIHLSDVQAKQLMVRKADLNDIFEAVLPDAKPCAVRKYCPRKNGR
jgi:phosphoglycerate dehydrogenase-like enzyme